ncbi:mitochondrial peptide methionine sulfoxide reductase [Platysternon megacephalum]|uniref:Mitochondrial peptide methionine sulfoxide reductase n=1 Tax=Platysternon megacephalum TaxID=55544 RepID=A0A4D9E375_9SAUR|nr:mitochondrial peptide methionine sulfoxide reductase [Platysternon megacephalum]
MDKRNQNDNRSTSLCCGTMENTPGLLNPLASPALLVLASTSEGTRSTSTPCQQPRHFGVPVAMEKPSQLPFLGAAYSLVYPHPDRLAPTSRDYQPQLLPLPPPFGPPSLERGGVGMLGYGALHPFAPFHLADDVECFPGGFLAGKRPKGRSGSEPPQVCCLALEKEMEAQRAQMGPEPIGGVSGLHPYKGSPNPRHGKPGEKKLELLALRCPLCQRELQCAELGQHLQQEIERLGHLLDREATIPLEDAQRSSQSPAISAQDGTDSPKGSPQAYEDRHNKVDRQQTFLRVKSNREGRMGARAGRFKRIRPCLEEQAQMEGPLPRLAEAEDEFSDESRCGGYEYRSPKKNILETKDCRLLAARSSDEADMDSDGDELPAFAKQTYPAPCGAEGGADLPGWVSKSAPAEDDSRKPGGLGAPGTARGKVEEEEEGDSTLTVELLKAQIQELRRRLLRKDSYKCHICLDSYSVPLTSIQCWHIHCEQCWLRTLGSKKLCPQCNAITSPADLRRVYL